MKIGSNVRKANLWRLDQFSRRAAPSDVACCTDRNARQRYHVRENGAPDLGPDGENQRHGGNSTRRPRPTRKPGAEADARRKTKPSRTTNAARGLGASWRPKT
jgi:hypothetical protein